MRFVVSVSNSASLLIISLHAPSDPTQHPAALRTQLSVLAAIHPVNVVTQIKMRVQLEGWHMTQDVFQALGELPDWLGELDFTFCASWPLKPSEYKTLAAYVPSSYGTWRLHMCPTSALFSSICEGVEEELAGLPGHLECVFPGYNFRARKVGAHVRASPVVATMLK